MNDIHPSIHPYIHCLDEEFITALCWMKRGHLHSHEGWLCLNKAPGKPIRVKLDSHVMGRADAIP